MDERTKAFNQQQREVAKPRIQRITRLRKAGETWTAIGRILGISRQRAQQLGQKVIR